MISWKTHCENFKRNSYFTQIYEIIRKGTFSKIIDVKDLKSKINFLRLLEKHNAS